jgi:hypothetical protein
MSHYYHFESPDGPSMSWGKLGADDVMEGQCQGCWHIYETKRVDGKWGHFDRGTNVPHKCPEKPETVTWDTTVRPIYKKEQDHGLSS